MTLTPWANGQTLSWGATCLDTLVSSYIDLSSYNFGNVAKKAAVSKTFSREKIERENHIFVPFA